MGRRRPSSKSKAGAKPRPVDRKDSKIKRWNKRSDVELDEEDQFHESRDKITLDQGSEGDEDDFGEEEVFALHGISDDDGDEAGGEADGLEDDSDVDMEDEKVPPKKQKSSKSKSKKAKKDSSPSPVEEEEETWGHGKRAYYSSNAAEIGSDDEEAQEMEEQEARRLQTKAREGLADEDFGLGEAIEGDVQPEETGDALDVGAPIIKEVPKDKQSLLRFLERENPETLALARDWDDTAQSLTETEARIEALKGPETNAMELGLQHMYYQALLTYMTTLAFYLHMRASEKYASRPQLLRSHPILKRLLTLKQSINMLENIGVHQDMTDEDEEEDEMDDLDLGLELEAETEEGKGETLWDRIMKRGLESDELAELIKDAEMSSPPPSSPKRSVSKKASKSSAAKEKSFRPVIRRPPSTESRQRKNAKQPPTSRPAKKSKSKNKGAAIPVDTSDTVVDPYGEVTALSHADAHDKQARKKSLRFHVSRIESSSARRQNARTNALGGDDDIPYRERKKARETKLEKERQKDKKLGTGGDDLDDVDPELGSPNGAPSDITSAMSHKSKKRRRGMEGGDDGVQESHHDDGLGYYDLVKSAVANKKAKKKADYEAAVAVSRPELEDDKSSGPRSISRAILKNKGLTPNRPKSVRNPRVKKRQKYEKAKKKVSSQRAVYKGGIGDISKYEGEKSGISKVVKSVALG
ncbi:Sas10 C-terminal domain-containing protein [Pisolithus orientalis]|uniref:Sas10 C-terminal domain-containing protein n=1 Tax=Pisolithus orientalis TaxID=936130 RepID=UPI002225894E|nr:Sas10 C-terminal domain-containing protein [Pisolithus orientalis]KAI6030544.1 Sas10 C-terminal domain-containing protein [Pisolithus orientalis]